MRAAILRRGRFVLDTAPDPVPLAGQMVVNPVVCGICGSDLHAAGVSAQQSTGKQSDSNPFPDRVNFSHDLILGHEFCCEVMESRPGSRFKAGTHVVSFPFIVGSTGAESLGFSSTYPGGFSEHMLVMEDWAIAVPNGLLPEHAALTEPLAVGLHAVERSGIQSGDAAMVIGCGPVGLAVVAALKAAGHGPVIASDFSPQRRILAEKVGADVIVNPGKDSPHELWPAAGVSPRGDMMMTAYAMREKFRRAVIFECVGKPGVIQSIIVGAPLGATIVCIGLCAAADQFQPSVGLLKEVDLRFSCAYTHDNFSKTLHRIADGSIDVEPFITGHAGLDGLNDALVALHEAGAHTKILVHPDRMGFTTST